jgi:phosphatidylethanolamine-binding protein (PEBP) family uncharacterized protein
MRPGPMKNIITVTIFFGLMLFITPAFSDDFSVSHLDADWKNGKSSVPKKGICKWNGGKGLSPELKLENIPDKTSRFLVSFTDRDYGSTGGHGEFKVSYDGTSKEFIIKSVVGETKELPDGYEGIKTHHSSNSSSGYYLGPCSGGRWHSYFVRVDALNSDGKAIAKAKMNLGNY